MAIETNKTYVLATPVSQSNGRGGIKLQLEAATAAIYAPYQGTNTTDELRGTSPNSILTLNNGRYEEARRDNYGINFYSCESGYKSKTPRNALDFSYWDVIAQEFRAALDAAGNTNPLYILPFVYGALSIEQVTTNIDLNVASEEFLKWKVDEHLKVYKTIQEDAGIGDPYFIYINHYGESSSTSLALAKQSMIHETECVNYMSDRGMPVFPTIYMPIDWAVSRDDYKNEKDIWVNNNFWAFPAFGEKAEDMKDQCVLLDASDANPIDKLDSETYAYDPPSAGGSGVHFSSKTHCLMGLIVMPRIIEVANGFGEDLTPIVFDREWITNNSNVTLEESAGGNALTVEGTAPVLNADSAAFPEGNNKLSVGENWNWTNAKTTILSFKTPAGTDNTYNIMGNGAATSSSHVLVYVGNECFIRCRNSNGDTGGYDLGFIPIDTDIFLAIRTRTLPNGFGETSMWVKWGTNPAVKVTSPIDMAGMSIPIKIGPGSGVTVTSYRDFIDTKRLIIQDEFLTDARLEKYYDLVMS